jgi:hypothetical protein
LLLFFVRLWGLATLLAVFEHRLEGGVELGAVGDLGGGDVTCKRVTQVIACKCFCLSLFSFLK